MSFLSNPIHSLPETLHKLSTLTTQGRAHLLWLSPHPDRNYEAATATCSGRSDFHERVRRYPACHLLGVHQRASSVSSV